MCPRLPYQRNKIVMRLSRWAASRRLATWCRHWCRHCCRLQNDREQQTAGDGGMILIFKHEIISTQSTAGAVECGVRWQHDTIAKVAEAFTGVAFAGVALDDWLKQLDSFVRRNADRHQAVE